jgi:hypothetical protein
MHEREEGDPGDLEEEHSLLDPTLGLGSRRGLKWTRAEIIVALAACPTENQDYDSRRPWVIELAELLGRSPAAISRHFGNFHSARRGGEVGLTHYGRATAEVYARFVEDPQSVLEEAAVVRRAIYERSSSPRVEQRTTEAEADRLTEELLAKFPEAHLPTSSIILYRRPGSVWVGVLFVIHWVLEHPDETRAAIEYVLGILGVGATVTPPAAAAIDGRQLVLAEREIKRWAPKLDLQEISEQDRVTLALQSRLLQPLAFWERPSLRVSLYDPNVANAERKRISAQFGIDASRLCGTCTAMLLDALDADRAAGLI